MRKLTISQPCNNSRNHEKVQGCVKGYRLTMATRFLTLGAATIISCLLVSLGMYQFRQARSLSNAVSRRMNAFGRYLQEEELTGYDGVLMKGSDVVNFYRRFLVEGEPDFAMVIVKETGRYFMENGEQLELLTEESSASYCRPSASFLCNVIKNENGVILRVEFKEVMPGQLIGESGWKNQ